MKNMIVASLMTLAAGSAIFGADAPTMTAPAMAPQTMASPKMTPQTMAAPMMMAPQTMSAPMMTPHTMGSEAAMRMKPPAVGEKPADFTLQTLDKKDVELTALLKDGPVVVMELRGWVGYQCPYCTQQTNDMISHAKEILATGAKVVMVYPGDAEGLQAHAQEFVAGKGLPEGFLFVTDPGKKFVTAWGLLWNKAGETAYPATFVVDKAGTVQFSKVSEDHAGRATSAEVLKALTGLK